MSISPELFGCGLMRPEHSIFGIGYKLLVDAETTKGSYELMYFLVPYGLGPPTHVHQNEDECYFITDGKFEATVGDETINVSKGDYLHLPRQIPHTIRNIDEGMSSFLCWVTPGNLGGFFDALKQPWPIGEKYPGMLNNQGIEQLVALAAKFDVKLIP